MKALKVTMKVLKRLVIDLFLAVYLLVALVNYSPVQSLLGSLASNHFSKEWGGKVKVGSIGCNPFNHLTLHNVELINPSNDTICEVKHLAVRFNWFPYDSHGLSFSSVKLKDGYYHLKIDSTGINLQYIIDYYKVEKKKRVKEFTILSDDVYLDNVCYRHDLCLLDTLVHDSIGVNVAHMYYTGCKAHIRNLRVDLDNVTCHIDNFSVRERSGLEVRKLQGGVYVTRSGISVTDLKLQTADSRIEGDVLIDYYNWKSMNRFFDSVYLVCKLNDGSYGGMQDAANWAHALWGLNQQISIEGIFWGPLCDFHADSVHLGYGEETELDFDGSIKGLPHINTTWIDANVHSFHTVKEDFASVRNQLNISSGIVGPLKDWEYLDFVASFGGTIRNFHASVDLDSPLGFLKLDAIMSLNSTDGEINYVGELSSPGINIHRAVSNEWLSHSGFNISFSGKGLDPKTMNATANGTLNHMVVRGHRILGEAALDFDAFDGVMSVEATLADALANIDIDGEVDWNHTFPSVKVNLSASQLDLAALGLWINNTDSSVLLDVDVSAVHRAFAKESRITRIGVNNLSLEKENDRCGFKNMNLELREQNSWKKITLQSDICEAILTGYCDLPLLRKAFSDFVDNYVPAGFLPKGHNNSGDISSIVGSRFDLEATWKDSIGFLHFFVPQLTLAYGTKLQTNYSFIESFKPLLRSDSIRWGNICFHNVAFNGRPSADRYNVRLNCDNITLGGVAMSENADVAVESSSNGSLCRVYWENSSQAVGGGDVALRLVSDDSLIYLLVDPSTLALGGKQWRLQSQGESKYFNDGRFIVKGLRLIGENEEMMDFFASKMGGADDGIRLDLRDFSLSVASPLLASSGITLDGNANGDMVYLAFEKRPYLKADMKVDNLSFGGELLGDATIGCTWSDENRQMETSLSVIRLSDGGDTLHPIAVNGNVSFEGKRPTLDFLAEIDGLPVAALQPFTKSFSSYVDGHLHAKLDVEGHLDSPTIDGYIYVDSGLLKVDFLNVVYSVADTINITPGKINLDRFRVTDSRGNVAVVNGNVDYSNLSNLMMDISLSTKGFLLMNTNSRQSKDFYGTVVASVDGNVRGAVDNLEVVLDATTLPGTEISVPISDSKQMKSADYIFFVSEFDEAPFAMGGSGHIARTGSVPRATSSAKGGVDLTINIKATPDLQLMLPLRTSTVDADVKAIGEGDLTMEIRPGTPFTIRGDYEMTDGTVMLNVFGVRNWEFSIEEGSTIQFPGSITDALFDIKAVYSQRVNMSSLTGSLSSTDSQKPINVENVIAFSGKLQSPQIGFDIRLPNTDQSVQDEVFAYIDRNNERDMLNQTISLLLLHQFYNAGANDMGSTSIEERGYGLFYSGLGSLVSGMVQFVDVNFDYKAGNALATDQYSVDISKEWNKFYFETTLGFGGEAREMSTLNATNNMTGDMLVGYKINPRFHLFAFNRSNTNDYTRSDLPYKQGLGLKYTRDFDSFGELFRRK